MIQKETKQQIIERYKLNENDRGSVEIQVALLTQQILVLTEHCQKNAKDFSSKRGLLKMVSKRRKFLKYLKKNNRVKYLELVESIGIRA